MNDVTAWQEERDAKRQAACEAWKERVNQVLMMHIGLIDEELCEQTAHFLGDYGEHVIRGRSFRHVDSNAPERSLLVGQTP